MLDDVKNRLKGMAPRLDVLKSFCFGETQKSSFFLDHQTHDESTLLKMRTCICNDQRFMRLFPMLASLSLVWTSVCGCSQANIAHGSLLEFAESVSYGEKSAFLEFILGQRAAAHGTAQNWLTSTDGIPYCNSNTVITF